MEMHVFDWLLENREWVFSGVGVSVLVLVASRFFLRSKLRGSSTVKNLMNIGSAENIYVESSVSIASTTPRASVQDDLPVAPEIVPTPNRLQVLRRKNPKLVDKRMGTKFIEERLPALIADLPKTRRRLKALIFLDIDDLTVINKQHGRSVGDAVLWVIAEFIESREAFLYRGRCGDDTFYGVLFKADEKKTRNLCEKLRGQIARFEWSQLAPELRVTCTIGYAILNPDENPHDWIRRSVHGMLEGKKQGGDIIRVAPEFVRPRRERERPFSLRDLIS